uniref:WWE domain-containing protein n=1 Tax=Pavo cristatus TaxID=9049 RepID=A0A8C9FRG8_PAVCR
MCDPVVCSYLTKTLCAEGGRLGLAELQQHVGLSAQQLRETLQAAGPERFLLLTGSRGAPEVLAVTAVRVCMRKECGGCERLHLCNFIISLFGALKLLQHCKYSHDITSAENKKVLKTHELSGLSENELRILLLQNDPFLLPDACQFYNNRVNTCNQPNSCNKLHICRHFLHGGCKYFPCKRSHNFLDSCVLRLLKSGDSHILKVLNLATTVNFLLIMGWNGKHNTFLLESYFQKGKRTDVFLVVGKKDDSSANSLKDNKEDKCDEICLFYVWKYCKHNGKPYMKYLWSALSAEVIAHKSINFQTMTLSSSLIRRLSTPSSVLNPTFVLTTKWIWYWKNDQGQWTEYGTQVSPHPVHVFFITCFDSLLKKCVEPLLFP